MPSSARQRFLEALEGRAKRLLLISTDSRLRPLRYPDIEPPLHAAVVACTSAWEAYVEEVTLEFLERLAARLGNPTAAFVLLLRQEAERAARRFRTPDFNNSRDFILRFTGYDPYPDMRSPKLKLEPVQVQTRLGEILKIRHAFAHGTPLPHTSWLQRRGETSKLTKGVVTTISRLLADIVYQIDSGLSQHSKKLFDIEPW